MQGLRLLAGGASKEAWAVEAGDGPLLVRRALGGVIHEATLSLEQEFAVLEAAYEAGVRGPRPVAYLGELGGREASVRTTGRSAEWGRSSPISSGTRS